MATIFSVDLGIGPSSGSRLVVDDSDPVNTIYLQVSPGTYTPGPLPLRGVQVRPEQYTVEAEES